MKRMAAIIPAPLMRKRLGVKMSESYLLQLHIKSNDILTV